MDHEQPRTLTQLLNGYRRFREQRYRAERARWEGLNAGQSPKVMVIACSDSRVDPAQIFDVYPGEIFVVRNVAALVPPYAVTPGHHGVSAALEFAVQFLKVEEIVVMGHGRCGGCQAALHQSMHGQKHGEGGFIADWIAMLDDAREAVVAENEGAHPDDLERAMELAAIRVSLSNLRSFPYIQRKEASGELALHGAFFAISDGVLHLLDETIGAFEPQS